MLARAEYSWTDRAYYDPSNLKVFSQGPYGLVNSFVGFNSTDGRGAILAGLAGAPRTYGVSARYHF
jgi:hypothetical protein